MNLTIQSAVLVFPGCSGLVVSSSFGNSVGYVNKQGKLKSATQREQGFSPPRSLEDKEVGKYLFSLLRNLFLHRI